MPSVLFALVVLEIDHDPAVAEMTAMHNHAQLFSIEMGFH
jgi:hypothetical protein